MKKIIRIFMLSLMIGGFAFNAFSQSAVDSANVTFQVDMSNVSSSFTSPEVNGTFNSWCGSCWQMTDTNGDNIWDVTGKVLKNTNHEFKFSADGWAIQENLFSGDPCVVSAFGFTNRTLNVSGDTTLPVVCWESCGPCSNSPSAYNVTFRLDMNNLNVSFTTPEVNGTFNGWCGSCWQMTDVDGDNIWEFTTLVAPGQYDFKFSADNWNIQEALDTNLSCVNWVLDSTLSLGYAANRFLEVISSDIILDIVPWNGCASVAVVDGCTDPTANNYNSSANNDDGSCTYDVTFTVDMNCSGLTVNSIAATGPSDNWSCNSYVLSDNNLDGVWEGTYSLPAGNFEYIYCADGWAQSEATSLLNNGTASGDWSCTPVTDYWSFANRQIVVGSISTLDTWGDCAPCASTIFGCTDSTATNYDPTATVDDGSCLYSSVLTVTTTVCNSASSVMMTGPWWNWDPTAGPVAVDNGNGTWTFTFDPAPTADMEYLLVVDGVQEDLTAANTASGDWSCTPITDYWSYANRLWTVGSGNVTNTYGTCGVCVTTVSGCTDSTATNYDPTATVDDGSCLYSSVLTVTTTVCNSASSVAVDNDDRHSHLIHGGTGIQTGHMQIDCPVAGNVRQWKWYMDIYI